MVFLDLEKAFELSSPLSILKALVRNGVSGRLLSWMQDYLHDREASVRFQERFTDFVTLEDVTP